MIYILLCTLEKSQRTTPLGQLPADCSYDFFIFQIRRLLTAFINPANFIIFSVFIIKTRILFTSLSSSRKIGIIHKLFISFCKFARNLPACAPSICV